MRTNPRLFATLAVWLLAAATARSAVPPGWEIPVTVQRLPNGLTVVVSPDRTAPTFGIAVVYGVGFRLEPRGRSGFAHLFEHMMFQGTPKTAKGVYSRVVEGGGGFDNASTRCDYTSYIATAPVAALEAIVWLEADRMRGLQLSEANLANQKDVVREEIREAVHNQPYGLFFWTDLAGLAFDAWANAHDGYGSFTDLEAATLADVAAFHRTYYAPNNAVVAVCGDVEPAQVFDLARRLFGDIPAQPPPPRVTAGERPNRGERTLVQQDAFAQVPGLAVGWKMPAPADPEYLAGAVLAELLLGGEASRLYQRLVKADELVLELDGGVNWPLGDYVSTNGPTLLSLFALYRPDATARAVLDAVQTEIDAVAAHGVAAAELERTKVMMVADFLRALELPVFRAEALALRQLFTADAASVARVPQRLAAVTGEDLRRVAARYLTVANRSWIDRRPAGAPPGSAGGDGGKHE